MFSSIVASFLIETYKTLLPDTGSQTVSLLTQLVSRSDGTATATSDLQSIAPSAVRINILLFLSLFFSVTSALVSTLILQWAREYLQYSQPSAAPHKRGRVRTYLFDGLSQFQMRRLNYSVPVLLHVSVFLFFFALSQWLHSINGPVGTTAHYCFVALLAVYMALSVLPLIVRNAPYQTALTTPLQASISLIHVSYIVLARLVRRSAGVIEAQKGSGLFRSIHIDRARALMREIKRKASTLDRSAMHWLLQELDEDDMDTFLGGLPGYIHSPLTDTNPVVEGLREDGVPGRIREHFKTCVTSVELSQEETMSRASSCINSLRLIFEASGNNSVRPLGLENDDMQAIMEYLEPLCYASSTKTALRASCVRSLVIREFLFPFAYSDPQELQTKKFPDYLMTLCKVIRLWRTTEISQWSHLIGTSPAITDQLPSEQEMWADILFDGPLINLAVLAYAILSCAGEEEVNLDMAWKTLEILLKALGLVQVRASGSARARFYQVLLMARASVSKGRAQTTPLLEALDTVISGIHLAGVFAYVPSPKLPPRQIEAIFGKEQLNDRELLEAFAAHLPGFVAASTPETSRSFLERLILENKLWEQLNVSLSRSYNTNLPFPDKLRIIIAFYDILDVVFEVLKDSSKIPWHSRDFYFINIHLDNFWATAASNIFVRPVTHLRAAIAGAQVPHVFLAQFSIQRSRGEPLVLSSLDVLVRLMSVMGLGSQEDREYFLSGRSTTYDPNVTDRAEATLSAILRDGPLLNFCRLGRWTFEVMLTKTSDVSSEDMKRPLRTLRRMLDTPHLPLVNAPGGMWAEFDRLLAAVRGVVALEGGDQNAENLQQLLEMIEEVNQIRPAAYERAEEMRDQTGAPASVIQDAWQPSEAAIPKSSERAEGPFPETGSSTYPTHLSPVRGVIPTAQMDQIAPGAGAWISHTEADPSATGADQPPTTSILTTQTAGPDTGIPYPYPPHAPRVHPLGFAPPHIPGTSGPRRASTLDNATLSVGVHGQSMLWSMPAPLGYVGTHPYPPSSLNSGPLDAPSPDHVNRGGPFSVRGPGEFPAPDSNNGGDSTYLFTCPGLR